MLEIAHAITDLKGKLLEADEAYCQLLEMTPAQLFRRDIMSVTHPLDRASNEASLEALVEQDKRFWIKKRYLLDGGRIIWVLNHVSCVTDRHGQRRITAACFLLHEEDMLGRSKHDHDYFDEKVRFLVRAVN